MDLTASLKKVGYDLIDSPIRNHKLTQLWLKKDFDKIQLYYDHISYAMVSTIELPIITNNALKVTSTSKNEYKFNVGMSVLEDVLQSLGLANFDLSAEIKGGKSVTISYDNSVSKEIEIGALNSYLSSFDFLHPNNVLLKYLNRNDIIIITGVLYAKNLLIEINTDFNVTAELKAKLTGIVDGKVDFSKSADKKITMTADTGDFYPIAVKASRLDFDHGKFNDQILITDNRNMF